VDYLSPFIILGYAITRIGCFLNGCCYGHITDLPWGVVYPAIDGFHRNPTQLYASLAALIIFFIIRYLKKYKYFHGYIFLYFIIFYGVYRFLVEYFRVSTAVLWGLSQAQIASLIFIISGALLLLYQKYRYKGGKV
jgi:phosphatidylglycerol:prolipoprotein diacylglycerol transferase